MSESHGDEHLTLKLDLDEALADVVDTIMLYGEYPEPRPIGKPRRPMQFSLHEYIENEWDTAEMSELLVPLLTDFSSDFAVTCMQAADDLRNELTDHLRDSKIVHERAEQLAQQKKEDAL